MKFLYSILALFLFSYVNAKSLPEGMGVKSSEIVVDMSDPCKNEVLSVLRYYLPYPSDESKYIECNPWGFYTIRQCETGFKWNSWLMSCVRISMEPPVDKGVGLIGVSGEETMNSTMNNTFCSYFGVNKCLNGGICNVYLDGSSRCLCLSNWTGVFCEQESMVSLGVFGEMINETFSFDLYKQQRPLLNTSLEFNMTDPEILKDQETKMKIEKYLALYPGKEVQYHELVNYLVEDFLSLLYPTSFYLQEFNYPSELQTGLSGAIPNLLMSARYQWKHFSEFMRVYEDILDNIVDYLVSKDVTIPKQAQLFYDVYTQIYKSIESKEGSVEAGKVEDLTREETVRRIGETFNMTLEKAYELFKVANKFDDELALKGENFTTEQIVFEIGNFSISPEVVRLVNEIQEINGDIWDSLSFYGFWYVLSSYVEPIELTTVVGTPTTVSPIGSKVSVRSMPEETEEPDFEDEATEINERSDEYVTDSDVRRELLLETTRVPKSLMEETTRVVKSLPEETTRIVKSIDETTRVVKSLPEETTVQMVPKSIEETTVQMVPKSIEETTRLPKSLLEETTVPILTRDIEETTRVVKSLPEETTRVVKSLPEETTVQMVPKSIEETTRLPKSLLEETTRVVKSLPEETTRIVKSIDETTRVSRELPEGTTRTLKSLLEETTRVVKSLPEETTRIVKSIEETTRVPKSLLEETTRVVKSLPEETTRIVKSIDETTRVAKGITAFPAGMRRELMEETTVPMVPKSIEETTRVVKSLPEETTRVIKSIEETTVLPERIPKDMEDMEDMMPTTESLEQQLQDLSDMTARFN